MTGQWTKAETVIQNANIITIDPHQPRSQALAILNGKFIAVGTNDEIAEFVTLSRAIEDKGKISIRDARQAKGLINFIPIKENDESCINLVYQGYYTNYENKNTTS